MLILLPDPFCQPELYNDVNYTLTKAGDDCEAVCPENYTGVHSLSRALLKFDSVQCPPSVLDYN